MVDGGVDFLLFVDFQWILMEIEIWCIPSSVFGLVQPCRGLFFLRKTAHLQKNMIFRAFQMIFHQNGPDLL